MCMTNYVFIRCTPVHTYTHASSRMHIHAFLLFTSTHLYYPHLCTPAIHIYAALRMHMHAPPRIHRHTHLLFTHRCASYCRMGPHTIISFVVIERMRMLVGLNTYWISQKCEQFSFSRALYSARTITSWTTPNIRIYYSWIIFNFHFYLCPAR